MFSQWLGGRRRGDDQKHVMPLKPLIRTHTMTFLLAYYWSEPVTCTSPKSMVKDAYSSNGKALKKVWMNILSLGGRE